MGLAFVGHAVFAVFQAPEAAPPGATVAAPINVSSAMQEKAGVLRVHAFRSFEDVLVVKDGGDAYLQLDTISGVPTGTCDSTMRGRMIVDTVNSELYVCVDAGWRSATLN